MLTKNLAMKSGIKKTNRITKFATKPDNKHNWHLVDADGKILGRLASEVAKRIRGKYNPQYTPNADIGDWVVVINAEKVKLTGKRAEQKEYLTYSLLSGRSEKKDFQRNDRKTSGQSNTLAVKRMLPKTKLGNKLINKLKVYKGDSASSFSSESYSS